MINPNHWRWVCRLFCSFVLVSVSFHLLVTKSWMISCFMTVQRCSASSHSFEIRLGACNDWWTRRYYGLQRCSPHSQRPSTPGAGPFSWVYHCAIAALHCICPKLETSGALMNFEVQSLLGLGDWLIAGSSLVSEICTCKSEICRCEDCIIRTCVDWDGVGSDPFQLASGIRRPM